MLTKLPVSCLSHILARFCSPSYIEYTRIIRSLFYRFCLILSFLWLFCAVVQDIIYICAINLLKRFKMAQAEKQPKQKKWVRFLIKVAQLAAAFFLGSEHEQFTDFFNLL